MQALGDGPLDPEWDKHQGIGGLDPRAHASAEIGRRNCELAARSIGEKARELLESLPPEERGFGLPELATEYWWEV